MRERKLAGLAMAALALGAAVPLVVCPAVGAAAGPDARARPAPQLVTAVADTSTITLAAGFSRYLYVGGSSAGAVITNTSFAHVEDLGRCHVRPYVAQSPIGPSRPPSPDGSFSTTGSVAALAGVALSGYAVRHIALLRGGTGWCGYPSGSAVSSGVSFATGKVGGLVLMLMGTNGVGNLTTPTLSHFGHGKCLTLPGSGLTTVQNVTVSASQDEGGAVAVFTASLPPKSRCVLQVDGTSFNQAGEGFSMWSNAYLLQPTG